MSKKNTKKTTQKKARNKPIRKKKISAKRRKETDIQKIVNYYFETKGISLEKIKEDTKKKKIIYARYTRPAKQLLELAGSVTKAKKAIAKIARWAQSRDLDYTIETVTKRWLEIDKLKPKKPVKKPFYQDQPLVWSKSKKKWYVVSEDNEWKEFAGDESEIEWREVK